MGKDTPCKYLSKKGRSGYILMSDNVDFRQKKNTRDKEEYYVIIKQSIHWGSITVCKMPQNAWKKN